MPYWDERVKAMGANYPDVKWDKYHIDILTARFVLHPGRFDVVVASNLFGDILSDLGPACTGTARRRTSTGQNIANPIGMIWSGAMMLEFLAAALVARHFRIGAQRPACALPTRWPARRRSRRRHCRAARAGRHAVRRLAFLDPVHQRRQHVELVGGGPPEQWFMPGTRKKRAKFAASPPLARSALRTRRWCRRWRRSGRWCRGRPSSWRRGSSACRGWDAFGGVMKDIALSV
jgi:hypothetical protein